MVEDASGDRSTYSTSTVPRVVFIHIPKTGGTTLKQVLSSNATHSARLGNVFKGGGGRVKEPDYERMVAKMHPDVGANFFWGHTPFAVASYVPPQWEANFITFLRDPVDRAISQYYAMVDRLDARGTDASDGDGVDNAIRGASRKQGVIRGEFSLDVPYEVALADAAFISDNLQTRMLCGLPRPFGEVTGEMLERAIENLGRFRCVGLAERFDESLVLLKRRIGYQSILYHHQRVNSSRPRGASVPEELRRAAEKANTFDRELYRHAAAQFESTPELGDLEFRIDLAALRSSRAGDGAPLPDAPPELGPEGSWWPALLAERRALLDERRAHARIRADTELQVRAERVQHPEATRSRQAAGAKAARRARRAEDANAAASVTSKQKRARDPDRVRRPKLRRPERRPRSAPVTEQSETGLLDQ